MYRRVEQIREYKNNHLSDKLDEIERYFKNGLCGLTTEELADAWCGEDGLRGPNCAISSNCRFYFTEDGWKKYGHRVVAAAQKSRQNYRIIRIKENEIEALWEFPG